MPSIYTPWAGHSAVGGRTYQEDAYEVFSVAQDVYSSPHLQGAVLADGMGGHAAGEVASATTCAVIAQRMKQLPPSIGPDKTVQTLSDAIAEADARVREIAERDSAKRGMGTTVAAAVVMNGLLSAAWCGDSRVYLFREDRLWLLSFDHGVVGEMIADGMLSPQLARGHPDSNIITHAVGVAQTKVDTVSVVLKHDDRVVLTSDGVTDACTDAELGEQLVAMGDDATPHENAEALVGSALLAKTRDNATAMVYRHDPPCDYTVSEGYLLEMARLRHHHLAS